MTAKTIRRPDFLAKGIKYISDIERVTQLPKAVKRSLEEVTLRYPFLSNDYYLSLIDWDNPNDSLRRLIIPNREELLHWGSLDASNEKSNTVVDGVQHKYGTTVLFLVNENCAGFCRYCFRKRLFHPDNKESNYDITNGLEYIRNHKEIDNVLITGGDPLLMSNKRLEKVLSKLRQIEHVRIIRFGSKMPAYNPFRILNDYKLLKLFEKYSTPEKRIYLMCHFDHPNELTEYSKKAIGQIQRTGVICVNQHPIIRGISDNPIEMAELWNELSYIGVSQYYVFQGRPTAGNKPFVVPIVEAYQKIEEAKRCCSGLAKRIKYVMSHESGKIEIVGLDNKYIYMKYHRARHSRNEGRFFVCHRDDNAYWLDQLQPADDIRSGNYATGLSTGLKFDSRNRSGARTGEQSKNIWP